MTYLLGDHYSTHYTDLSGKCGRLCILLVLMAVAFGLEEHEDTVLKAHFPNTVIRVSQLTRISPEPASFRSTLI